MDGEGRDGGNESGNLGDWSKRLCEWELGETGERTREIGRGE